MVSGFDTFREQFRGYEDCYTIIGGTACDILMTEAALDFRATKDIDVILLIENRFEEFARVFWDFVRRGEYRCGWRGSEKSHFYRFTNPQPGFPKMIELFSRRPDFQAEHPDVYLTPLPVSDEISSLSAIMLDDDYYNLMLSGRILADGVSVLETAYLIAFKVKAFLDLRQKKAEGTHVDERDIKKHKNDVFRLFSIVDPTQRIVLPEKIRAEIQQFLDIVGAEPMDLKNLGLGAFAMEEVLNSIREIYQL